MKRAILAIFLTICSSSAMASQMTYGFQNPQFRDDPSAWISHALTIGFSCKQALAAQQKAAAAEAAVYALQSCKIIR